MNKKCFKCGGVFPLDSFYKNKSMKDGLVNKCKQCNKKDVAEHYRANRVRIQEGRKEYNKDWWLSEKGRALRKGYTLRWLKENPKKHSAGQAVRKAVHFGKIKKPSECEECGSVAELHGHHDDYNRRLDVRWLCATCHRQWHAKNGEAPNAA